MGAKSFFTGESIFSVLLTVLGAAVMTGAVELGLGGLDQPGAGFFPFLAGAIILVSAITITTMAGRPKSEASALIVDKNGVVMLAVLIATLAGWILLMPWLGYIVVTFVAVFVMVKVLGASGYRSALILAAATSFAIYVLFDRLLYLDLPRGWFGQG